MLASHFELMDVKDFLKCIQTVVKISKRLNNQRISKYSEIGKELIYHKQYPTKTDFILKKRNKKLEKLISEAEGIESSLENCIQDIRIYGDNLAKRGYTSTKNKIELGIKFFIENEGIR